MKPIVYLAGPIDDIPLEHAQRWRDIATTDLEGRGVAVYDPTREVSNLRALVALDLGRSTREIAAARICSWNRRAIGESVCMLAALAGPGRAFGTIREIEYAKQLQIPVVLWANPPVVSFEAWDLFQYPSYREAMEHILQIVQSRVSA